MLFRSVGESLLCATTRVFREIGVLPALEAAGFVRKPGATWTRWPGGQSSSVRFAPMPYLGVELDYTWHVDRSRLDALLLEQAAHLGATVLQGERVTAVEFHRGRATGVRLADGRVLSARLVVDASGRQTLLGKQLGLKRTDPEFDQFTMHGWFTGFDRGAPATAEHAHVHVLAKARCWLWQIPIDAEITSLGLVTRRDDFHKSDEAPAAWFARQLADHPALARRFAAARPVHDLVRESNYSYALDRIAGDGWIVLGDAGRFVDPLFSSGVSVAAESARLAVAPIREALRAGDVRGEQFADWARTVRGGAERWREFIRSFYRLPPLFLELLADEAGRARLRPFLQGDVLEPDVDAILHDIGARIDQVAADPGHPWHRDLVAVD